MKKKKIYIITISIIGVLLALALIVGGAFIIYKININESLEVMRLKDKFAIKKLIPVAKDSKYGYMNYKGKQKIAYEYSSAYDYENDYALVARPNELQTGNNFIYQLIDEKNRVIITTDRYEKYEYFPEYQVYLIDGKLFDKNLAQLSDDLNKLTYLGYGYFIFQNESNGLMGIIDYQNKIIVQYALATVEFKMSKNNFDEVIYLLVKNADSEIIINLKTGVTVYTLENENAYINPLDNNIFQLLDKKTNDIIKVFYLENDQIAYENKQIVSITREANHILKIDYGYYYNTISKEQREYYINLDTKDELKDNPNGYDLSKEETEYGYGLKLCNDIYGLTQKGKDVISCSYEKFIYLPLDLYNYLKLVKNREYIFYQHANRIVLYNLKNHKEINSYQAKEVVMNENSSFAIINIIDNEEKITAQIVYNLITGKEASFAPGNEIKLYSNYITIQEADHLSYYNANLKKIR